MPYEKYDFGYLDKECFARLAKLGLDPHVIFDVGASNGYWSKEIVSVFPSAEFHLFEPLVEYVSDYQFKMNHNLETHPNFNLHKVALGENNGENLIHIFKDGPSSTMLEVDDSVHGSKTVTIPTLTIDTAISTLHLPTPQVIKIDTQGSELKILKGAKNCLANVDVLLLETWVYRGYGTENPLLHELINWLLPYGFYIWDICDMYRGEDGMLASIDFFFINTKSNIVPKWHWE